jgi:GntR family transcriptional regulator, transcriptional repressor for pyruvate dehydrogenase complex
MARDALQPIQRSPLYEQVVARLRDFIDLEELRPGDRLMSERDLAERLGVSRTSVRQALTVLRVQGLVEIRHGDGVYLVTPPGDMIPSLALEVANSEVDHPMIWEVREGIEVQSARLAARRRTDEDLAGMAAALAGMDASISHGGDGILGDRHFHRAVAQAAHNELLAQLHDQLRDLIDRTSEASLTRPGRPPVSLEEHREIFEAVERGDEDDAVELMRVHIMESGRRIHGGR